MAQKPRITRVEAVVNIASGTASPEAAERMSDLLAEHGISARVHAVQGEEVGRSLRAAIDAGPDLVAVLAGDGTARAAAEMAGPDGPLIAPLAGGTMNMLPYAIYGDGPWDEALAGILEAGEERGLGGGCVDGRSFLVAAILGAPALWAPAREAMRDGRISLALGRMRRAWTRAFSGRLRYALDGGPRGKAEALAFMCPIASKVMADDDQALEAAIIDPQGLAQAARIGLSAMVADWRNDPSVTSLTCRTAGVWAAGRIPAVLDGEPARLPSTARIEWRPQVARILAPLAAPAPAA
jgi:diacylglycerol kinase family enzyme